MWRAPWRIRTGPASPWAQARRLAGRSSRGRCPAHTLRLSIRLSRIRLSLLRPKKPAGANFSCAARVREIRALDQAEEQIFKRHAADLPQFAVLFLGL